MYADLNGKVALVTGAGKASGIGYAICKKLASNGCNLIIADMGQAVEYNSDVVVGSQDEMMRLKEELSHEI